MEGQRGSSGISRGIELLLWTVAALCFAVIAFAVISDVSSRRAAGAIVPRTGQSPMASAAGPSEGHPGGTTAAPSEPETRRQAGDVIGRLEIPQIGLSVPMTAGIETSSLLRGVGHIEGTALPGGLGTLGLAGHRDTYFRPLRRIASGMEIRVIDATGTYHYTVDTTEIVMPEQVEVLAIQARPELTLITCYPFDFIGAAPKRFIVHAHLLSVAADETR